MKERSKELLQVWQWDHARRFLRPAPEDTSRTDYEIRQSAAASARAAAGPAAEARAWWERAHRFTPGDPNLAARLAGARLADGDPVGALALFTTLAERHAIREILAGQAAAALLCGRRDVARAVLHRALARFTADSALLAVAARLGEAWCGLTPDLRLCLPAGRPVELRLDGRKRAVPVGGALPPSWLGATRLSVRAQGDEVLGSPIELAVIRRVEGFAARTRAGVAGWAWHPGAPEWDPVLTIDCDGRTQVIVATDANVATPGSTPLARPRAFRVASGAADRIHVRDAEGREVWGSPVGRDAAPPRAPRPRRGTAVAVVIPVYRGEADTLACISAVLATIGRNDRVIAVNDASPEPRLVKALGALHAAGQITLVDSDPSGGGRNMGFPAAANAGLRAAGGADTVLLNSDTVVFAGWLARLRAAAHAAPDIGTATPLSNDASIFSYPHPGQPAAMPGAEAGAALAEAAAAANAGVLVEVPTAHGFCMFIRAACLHATGLLRQDVFAQGYGEENDFCERARAIGWRHVAVPGVYVAHRGGVSFGAARGSLLARNAAVLHRLHPGYHGRVARFIAADPLAEARRRIDAARWRALHATGPGAMLLVSHGGIGGTTKVVAERAAAAVARGLVPVVIGAADGLTTIDADAGFANLRFRLPRETPALTALLAASRPVAAELHNLLGHTAGITDLLSLLGVPYEAWVHDWGWLCARVALVTPEGHFCGEPPVRDCAACEARGEKPAMALPTEALRRHSAAILQGAERVIVASQDAATRMRRHFPACRPTVVPWEAGAPSVPPPPRRAPGGWLTVAVVGAISREKGHDRLIACARDAAARGLQLRFAVIGYTVDDDPLLATGHVTVTGRFAPGEATALIRASGAALAFLPSIWPETWCYALSDVWDAGLRAAVFDIGAPAERVRDSGAGWVLPLGLTAPAVNDALLRLQDLAGRSWPQEAVGAAGAALPFQERDQLP